MGAGCCFVYSLAQGAGCGCRCWWGQAGRATGAAWGGPGTPLPVQQGAAAAAAALLLRASPLGHVLCWQHPAWPLAGQGHASAPTTCTGGCTHDLPHHHPHPRTCATTRHLRHHPPPATCTTTRHLHHHHPHPSPAPPPTSPLQVLIDEALDRSVPLQYPEIINESMRWVERKRGAARETPQGSSHTPNGWQGAAAPRVQEHGSVCDDEGAGRWPCCTAQQSCRRHRC